MTAGTPFACCHNTRKCAQMTPSMERWVWAGGAAATAGASVLFGHLSHFTWWGVFEFYLLCLLNAVGCGDRFILAYVFQAVLIIGGVAAMSASGCFLLKAAAVEWSIAYLPLNFLVHFAPSLVAIAFAPRTPPVMPAAQIVFGGLTFIIYASTRDGPHTYGCDIPTGVAPVAVLVATGAMLFKTPLRLACAALTRPE